MRVLLTGAAGFIGFHLARALLARGDDVLGIDSFNSYYDPELKNQRLAELGSPSNLRLVRADIADAASLEAATAGFRPNAIVHLAAQAGVRYSLENPLAYVDANVRGQVNVLELARRVDGLSRLLYASSSSVYGDRTNVPFKETDPCDQPVSVYAATKRSAELLAGTYARLYGLSPVGLRFFTVYGPWGRPDMAYWLFSEAILTGKPIRLFNKGDMRRDFTDVRDIVGGMLNLLDGKLAAGHQIYNVGHSEPVTLRRFLSALEAALGRKAEIELAPMQPGDVGDTYADVSKLQADYGYSPRIGIEEGLIEFAGWFRKYRGL